MKKNFRFLRKINSIFLIAIILIFNSLSFSLKAQEPSNNDQIKPQPSITESKAFTLINEKLEQERLSTLAELKTKLEQRQKRNRADLFLIFNERFFNNLLSELTKRKFNAANLFDLTVIKSRMLFLNGLALAQLETKLTSTNPLLDITTMLNITAKLSVEQNENNSLVAKFQIVDIQNPNSEAGTSTLPKVSPEQIEKLLPPVTLPLELDFDRIFEPDKFSQTKPIAYELSTEARRIRGRFKIIDLLALKGRLVLLAKVQDLSITQGQAEGKKKNKPKINPSPASFFVQQEQNALPNNDLDKQIDILSENLASRTDFSINIKRHFLDLLADEFAQSTTRDVIIKVMRSRVISSKSDLGFAKYENYLDIENGDGTLDLKDAEIQNMQNGQINLFIDAVGQIQAQARGKQIGFEYDANPQIGVSLRDQIAFTFEQVGQDFQIKPVAKKISVHLDIRVPVQMIGQDIKTSQNVSVDTTTLIKPVILPKVINTNLVLPQGSQAITLTEVNYKIEKDQLFFGANLTFSEIKVKTQEPQ
ncbi:MAG: hypothetical protein HY819_04350 [Acidobacteria bacterium]|nr:hypothetical protein [Acidobacteriota bacterium]